MSNPLNLFAVLVIPKDVQFSEKARAEGVGYLTYLVPGRSLEEVAKNAEHFLEAETNTRVVIYDLGAPATVRRLSLSSVAPRPRVVLKRDGSFA